MRKILLLVVLSCILLTGCASLRGGNGGDEGYIADVSLDDAEMNAAIQAARDTLPLFIAALQEPSGTQIYFAIKVGFPYGEAGEAEHMWVDNLTYSDGQFQGVLNNEPVLIPDLAYGDAITASPEDVSDWMIVDDSGLLGGYTLHVLRNRMSESEREQFDADFGVAIPDSPALP